jgi:hypothetical protein
MRTIAVLVALLTTVSPAFAWSRAGHMVSGAIAYASLKQDRPDVLARVVQILKAHPQFSGAWAKRLDDAPDGDRDLMLFMLAARWPDDIRDDSTYHHSRWHYINVPIKPPGQPDSVRPAPPDADNILRAFEINRSIVADSFSSDEQKAVALCWIFHLVGDGHQPLHSVSLFTTQFPRGDRGGNSFRIRVRPTSTSVINLHKFWDDLIIGSDNPRGTRNRATELRLRPEFARHRLPELKEKRFDAWVTQEGVQLARDVVYRNGELAGSNDLANAPTLPEDYIAQAKSVGERRVVLAGYRLADVLIQNVK